MERVPLAILVAVSDPADPDVVELLASLSASNADALPVHVVRPDDVGAASLDEVPLAFWEFGHCDHYWAVDPKIRFLRSFTTSDLMAAPDIPYAFLTEDAERAVDPQSAAAWVRHRDGVERIREAVGLADPRVRSSRHGTLYSARVLESFRDEHLAPRGMTYADALAMVSDAAGWYSAWLQAAHAESFVSREPIVLDLDTSNRAMQLALRQETVPALSRSFVAVRACRPHTVADAAPGDRMRRQRIVAERARPGELLKASWLRIYRQLPSLQRLVARVRRA